MASKKSISINVGGNFNDFKDELNQAQKAYKQTLTSMTKKSKDSAKVTKQAFRDLGVTAIADTEKKIKRLQQAFDVVKRSGKSSAKDIANAQKALKQRIKEVRGEAEQTTTAFGRMSQVAVGLFSFEAMRRSGVAIADAGMQMEGINQSLKAATGTAEGAAEAFDFVASESERLGLSLPETAQAFTRLTAAAKGTALEGQDARNIFTAVSEAMTVMGASADQSQGALTAIEQMISKGKVSAEELRGQLGERLPGAFNIAAEAMGVTTAQLDKMMSNGELMAEDFLPRFADAIRNRFAGSVAEASESARASFNRFNNAIFNMKVELAEGGILDAIGEVAKALTQLVNEAVVPAIAFVQKLGAAFGFLMDLDWGDMLGGDSLKNKLGALEDTLNAIDKRYDRTTPAGGGATRTSPAASRPAPVSTGGGGSTTSSAAATSTPQPYQGNINFDPYAWRPDMVGATGGDNVYLTLPGGDTVGPMKADGEVVSDLKKSVAREALKSGKRACQ